ncbi:pyridoxamine 5'-phosphate oxidase family protein [Salinibacterium sp. G-O1]|uniref:pyridoxamine 5'-phosphate oxidase family protein n=1 Tax=Salinibacterium sp. G-O1 TaxID=3046208 RepID=UPI0024B97C4E|nr:pyridoxamine 5'-phosphate oxidase family protein [Salinibacterium sp. G-O1]MDJ0335637.1 pyridoxamine 5'-phosphate oxidase family protein [Salinibacterium sp. G-O1]
MTSWADIEADAPAFAARLRTVFDAGTNKTLATLRLDGSPRISGTELEFDDGRITLGMMPDSRKLVDVQRDGRVAIHSPTIEPPKGTLGLGDAKIGGVLFAIDLPRPDAVPGFYFELDINEAVLTSADGEQLVVEFWHPGRGLQRIERK